MRKEFKTKKDALKYIEKLSFRSWDQEVKILYRAKKWVIIHK